jgi:tetratricopeptide (TPR) repeat protein
LNVTEFTYLLNHPNAINEKQAKSLEIVLDNFPYFQSARALHLKGLYNQDSYKYNFALKNTAAHTTDRSVLFNFITSDEFTIIEKDIYQQKLAQLLNIDVNESEYLTEDTVVVKKTEPEVTNENMLETVTAFDEFVPKIKSNIEELSSESINEFVEFIYETKVIEETVSKENIHLKELTEIDSTLEITKSDLAVKSQLSVSRELEENLEIGKPITFVQNEKHSFQEWLQLASFKPIDRKIISGNVEIKPVISKTKFFKEENLEKKSKKIELIDKFIETNPKITPSRGLVDTPIKSLEIPDTTHLMTETLARVYLEQKKYQKAIQAYEILILKYPEKSIFFADRIHNIKILQQNNQ